MVELGTEPVDQFDPVAQLVLVAPVQSAAEEGRGAAMRLAARAQSPTMLVARGVLLVTKRGKRGETFFHTIIESPTAKRWGGYGLYDK